MSKKIAPTPPPKNPRAKFFFFFFFLFFLKFNFVNPNRNSWVDSSRSACAIGKWAPPLANAILPMLSATPLNCTLRNMTRAILKILNIMTCLRRKWRKASMSVNREGSFRKRWSILMKFGCLGCEDWPFFPRSLFPLNSCGVQT